jgi:hypothetical protein
MVARVLASIPRRHETLYILSLRRLSKYIRRSFRDEDHDAINFQILRKFFNADLIHVQGKCPENLQNDPVFKHLAK